MRIDLQSKDNCCGCTACVSICTHDAIAMAEDRSGFLYPIINQDKCVDCGLCANVCQFKKNYDRYDNFETPFVYAGRQRNIDEVAKSQTGGLAAIFYEKFIADEGEAYGVCFDSELNIVFASANNIESAQKFRGSKYVQADIVGIFSKIKESLRNGKRVLFVGSPCQVAGLKSYIPNILHKELLTVDLVCHCNTSPGIWRDYIQFIEQKHQSKIVKANFRNKKFGWHSCLETYTLANGKEIISKSYDFLFFKHLSSRPACTNCPYTNLKRVGDITIGDYWGWEKKHREWNDNLGVNLILVNSIKGTEFLKSAESKLDLIKTDVDDCLQPQLISPIKINSCQEKFFTDYHTRGIQYVLYKYGDLSYFHRFRQYLSCIKKKLLHL